MTLQTVMLAITAGASIMIGAAIGLAIRWIVMRMGKEDPPSDPQSEMYAAFQRCCAALDDAALDGDTARYDRIKKVGWRNFGVDAA